nr:ribonuclease H-like domain-containing protein [Tanacetum cinerariifolium]
MQKILTQMNTLKIKPDPEDVDMKFLRGLPPSWSGIALILKTKGGLKYISFDDLYKKLKFLESDTKGYSSSFSTLSNAAFLSTVGSSQANSLTKNQEMVAILPLLVLHIPRDPQNLNAMNKEDFEEYDLKHQMAMLSIKVHRFEKKHGRKIKFNGRENARTKIIREFWHDAIPAGVYVFADTIAAVVVRPQSETEFVLMGLSTEVSISVTCPLCCDSKYKLIDKDYQGQREQLNDCMVDLKAHKKAVKILEKQIKFHQKKHLACEEKIRVLSYELQEKSNILEYRQKLINQAAQEKQELMTKLENEIANQAKWNNSGKNLYKLIDSSMSVRTKRGLGLDKYIREGELGIDDSKGSIFYTNSYELEGQPIYNRFASVDYMKAIPPPLTGNYMPPSNVPDIDGSQMVYGKK